MNGPVYGPEPSWQETKSQSTKEYTPTKRTMNKLQTESFSVMFRAAGEDLLPGREEFAIHEWKRLVQITSFRPGHERTKDDLDDEHCQEVTPHFLNPWGLRDRGLRIFKASQSTYIAQKSAMPRWTASR